MHSYIITNNTLLCSECIEERNLSRDKYKPIPQVAKQIMRSLVDQKYSKELCLIQLNNFEHSLEYELQSQKDRCRQKIEDYFKKLKDTITSAEVK